MLYAPGESGSYLYVAAEGEYDVIKDGKVLGRWTNLLIICKRNELSLMTRIVNDLYMIIIFTMRAKEVKC